MVHHVLVIENAKIISFSEEIEYGCIIIEEDFIKEVKPDVESCNTLNVPSSTRIDVKGKTVIPAFIDAHAHLLSLAKKYEWLDLSNVPTLDNLKKMLRKIADKIGPGKWILGYGWDESYWSDEKRFPTLKDLDEAVPDNPILIRRVDGHMAVVNSQALMILKIPENVRGLEKNKDGSPSGIIKEDALEYALKKIQYSLENLKKGLKKITKSAWKKGVAASHETCSMDDLTYLSYLLNEDEYLGIDFYLFIMDQFLDLIIECGLHKVLGKRIKVRGIKVFSDGSIGARTAALREPYSDDPTTKGLLLKDKDDLSNIFRKANKAGLQLAVHAIGDRAIDVVLDAFKEAGIDREMRHRIEHFELAHEEHIKDAKRLGIILSMQPNFVGQWQMPGGMYERRLGRSRWRKLNPFRQIFDENLIVAFGSDCMPFDPIFGIWSAVNHPIEESRISVLEAIKAYTLNAAYAAHQENFRGDIRIGYKADLAILSQDPMSMSPKKLRDINVLGLILNGKVRYISIGL